MNNVNIYFKSLILITALNSNVLFAQTYPNRFGCLGVDLIYSTMKINRDWGGNVFSQSSSGINFYLGKEFYEYFGAEVGYEAIKNKTKFITITNPQTRVFGAFPQSPPEEYKSTIKRNCPYLGLTSIFSINNNSFIQLLIGATLVQVKSYSILVSQTFFGQLVVRNIKEPLNKSKVVPTVKVSFGANIFNDLGIKASFSWTNTQSIKRTNSFALEPKNSINIGSGLIYHL